MIHTADVLLYQVQCETGLLLLLAAVGFASNPQPPVIRVPSVELQKTTRSLGSIPAAAAAAAAGCWSNLSRSAFAKRPSSTKPSPPPCGGTGGSRGIAPVPSLPSIVDRFGASICVFPGFPCEGVFPGAVSITCQRRRATSQACGFSTQGFPSPWHRVARGCEARCNRPLLCSWLHNVGHTKRYLPRKEKAWDWCLASSLFERCAGSG